MQNNILEKLKIKNAPKTEIPIEFNLPRPQEDININTTIVDQTKERKINKNDYCYNLFFLEKMMYFIVNFVIRISRKMI